MDARQVVLCVAAAVLLAQAARASLCPQDCMCSTTTNGLHKATCSNLLALSSFLQRKKHHNINILDLSHNNITTINREIDRLSELVSLDLSTNGFSSFANSFPNAEKLVHINLANNRIKELSLSKLPAKLSSLDLSNNLIQNLPSDLQSLPNLEHLELEGNPIVCSCKNLLIRNYLLSNDISTSNLRCHGPKNLEGIAWMTINYVKDICKSEKQLNILENFDKLNLHLNALHKDTFIVKFKPAHALADLDVGQTWAQGEDRKDEESDDKVFLRTKRQAPVHSNSIEGSGDVIGTEESSHTSQTDLSPSQMEDEEFITSNDRHKSNTAFEGSGEGSGLGVVMESEEEDTENPTTVGLYTDHINAFLGNGVEEEGTEIPNNIMPQRPSVYQGQKNWYDSSTTSSTTETNAVGAEKIQIEKSQTEQTAKTIDPENPPVQRTGTYICVAIIVVLLVGLIGFACIKSQMRRRRDLRLQRQQKRDIEKASKEMVDMNTSLLGKPAPIGGVEEKRGNGKYELVPTHETPIKKCENGNLTSSNDVDNNKGSPRDNNQNREERPRSLIASDPAHLLASKGSPSSPGSNKKNDSLSSEEIFVPGNEESPQSHGVTPPDTIRPLLNGAHTDSDYLSPSREYVPVYSPDMGRVRIKLTETPKPKTPVLVNRSRSNAGDIVVTPSIGKSVSETAT